MGLEEEGALGSRGPEGDSMEGVAGDEAVAWGDDFEDQEYQQQRLRAVVALQPLRTLCLKAFCRCHVWL